MIPECVCVPRVCVPVCTRVCPTVATLRTEATAELAMQEKRSLQVQEQRSAAHQAWQTELTSQKTACAKMQGQLVAVEGEKWALTTAAGKWVGRR